MKKYFDRIYNKGIDSFYSELKESLKNNKKSFIITANPETFMYGEKDETINEIILDDKNIIVPDGIGIVKASNMLGYNIKERIPGIDIAMKLLEYGNELHKTIYLFGAKKEVLDKLVKKIEKDYPNLKIDGYTDGYITNKDQIMDNISKLSPDIVLVALGIPFQEKLIYNHLNKFKKGIFVGVGGSFDVLSGCKKRAPKIFIKTNTEWLYRILKEPKRIKRFYNSNVKFLFRIRKIDK